MSKDESLEDKKLNQKKLTQASAKQYQIVARRAKVAALVRSGSAQREIAKALNLSVGTVNADLKALLEDWRSSSLRDIEMARTIDLERIDAMTKGLWTEIMSGNMQAIDRLISLIKLRKDIFGYDRQSSTPEGNQLPITTIEVRKNYDSPDRFRIEEELIE